MDMKHSEIMNTTISKLFPFVIIFSFYLFSYGPITPGGGFQAGVIFGTLIIIFEMCYENKVLSEQFYSLIEFGGVFILALALMLGLILTGKLFGGFYRMQTGSMIMANFYLWLLNFAIFIEVSGSIVLIFRNFIEWKEDE